MKTAILMCGQPREMKHCWESFRDHVYSQMPNPDVFIYSSQYLTVGNEFFDTFQPKAFKVEDQITFPDLEARLNKAGYHNRGSTNACLQQIYGWKKVWELKQAYELETGTEYDLVVRVRPDTIFLRPITLDLFDLEKINNLHSPHDPKFAVEFVAGPNHLMETFCGTFDWLDANCEQELLKSNPRIDRFCNRYDCDTIVATHLFDHKGVPRAEQKLPPEAWSVHHHYRIWRLHIDGCYERAI